MSLQDSVGLAFDGEIDIQVLGSISSKKFDTLSAVGKESLIRLDQVMKSTDISLHRHTRQLHLESKPEKG